MERTSRVWPAGVIVEKIAIDHLTMVTGMEMLVAMVMKN